MVRGWGGNMDNYAMINGNRVELTDEQVKMLGVEMKINPFNRMGLGSYCYVPHIDGTVGTFTEDNSTTAKYAYRNCSYFNDKDFAKQVALHQLLYRKLLKFSYDYCCDDTTEWNNVNPHWFIRYRCDTGDIVVYAAYYYKCQYVYFSSEKGAMAAIEEVVRPFMKEHPEFVW